MINVPSAKNSAVEIPREISEHVLWLEQATAEALAQIRITSAELNYAEQQVQDFLDEYYSEVGKYFGDLDKVNQAIRKIQEEANDESTQSKGGQTVNFEKSNACEIYIQRGVIRDEEAKQLFRKLAKYSHPDTSGLQNAKEIFAEANSAYERRDLCALILLEQQIMERLHFEEENPVAKLERLEKKYQMAVDEYKKLLQRKEKFKCSAAYQLWNRVFKEKARGRDIVREVKLNVMQEISAKRKILARKKQEKELTAV